MQNIPVFSTEFGVGSLILREIPYKGAAYVRVQDTACPKEFIEECAGFCRMAGAEKIYAVGHPYLENYPFHTAVWRMTRPLEGLPDTDAALLPVTDQTLARWLEIYNQRMAKVDNSAFKNSADGKELLKRGDGYFVHRGETLLGIGIAAGDTLDAVISVIPGAGKDVLLALCHALSGEQAVLEVASTNAPAIRLYERLGFLKTAELSRWYKIS